MLALGSVGSLPANLSEASSPSQGSWESHEISICHDRKWWFLNRPVETQKCKAVPSAVKFRENWGPIYLLQGRAVQLGQTKLTTIYTGAQDENQTPCIQDRIKAAFPPILIPCNHITSAVLALWLVMGHESKHRDRLVSQGQELGKKIWKHHAAW